MKNKNIPKKIHLIGLGDKSKFNFDLKSLEKFAPNYEIKIGGEEDFDGDELLKIPYVKKTYKLKQGAFLSDYLRAKILYEEGGIYLDADMKIIKFIEGLFSGKELVLAFENTVSLSMGVAGAVPKNPFFKEIKEIYEGYKSGKLILGNVIWNYVAKKVLNIKINGMYKEGSSYIVHNYKSVSLLKPRLRKGKRENQIILHQHTISGVPKKGKPFIKFLIIFTQKITIFNKFYYLVIFGTKKQMYKYYVNK